MNKKIKKLEWENHLFSVETANGHFGKYYIYKNPLNRHFRVEFNKHFLSEHADLESAKTIAQNDFERRVMECFE
jgi:hypothetical protein